MFIKVHYFKRDERVESEMLINTDHIQAITDISRAMHKPRQVVMSRIYFDSMKVLTDGEIDEDSVDVVETMEELEEMLCSK